MVHFEENHCKRMGTLIAMLGVKKLGDLYSAVKLHIRPFNHMLQLE